MPKPLPKLTIKINILKPQGNPEKLYLRLSKWALSTGRYIIIFVEIIVLAAFVSRFKFDSDFADTKEKIDQQIPFIESRKTDEQLIRQTQLQLATIKDIRLNAISYISTLKSIASQTPLGVKINNLNISKKDGRIGFSLNGNTKTNAELISFVSGLKTEKSFSEVTLNSLGFEEALLNFSISGNIKQTNIQNQQL